MWITQQSTNNPFLRNSRRVGMTSFNKHSVPTKSTPNVRLAFGGTEDINIRQPQTTKLTPMVRLGNRTISVNLAILQI